MKRIYMIGGAMAAGIATISVATNAASAKTPGREYCFHGTCHTVKTLEETRSLIGVTTKMKASYYDDPKNDRYNPSNITSSGEYFRSDRPDNAASPIYPDGTKLLVWHPSSGKALMIRVNNAGPYWGDRKLDLSRAAAEKFGFTGAGVSTVHVNVLEAPTKADSTYKHGRNYPAVKGYLGQFASLDTAAGSIGSGTRLAINEPERKAAPTPALTVAKAAPVKIPATASVAIPVTLPVLAASAASMSEKPIRLSALELKIVNGVEHEARRLVVASRSIR
jgi:rare lipoprotein A